VETAEAAEVNPYPAPIMQAHPCKIIAGVAAGHRSCSAREDNLIRNHLDNTKRKCIKMSLSTYTLNRGPIINPQLSKIYQSSKFPKHNYQLPRSNRHLPLKTSIIPPARVKLLELYQSCISPLYLQLHHMMPRTVK
jgi:hypothetical protein